MIYFIFPRITSTQSVALTYHATWGVPNTWVVFRALTQSQGYGRRGTHWKSSLGNLFMSILFPVPAHPKYLTTLALIGANALIDVLKEYNINAYLKHPNDVLVENKKISGLLGQVLHTHYSVWGGILGIGLNVNSLPDIQDSSYKATSLREISQRTWDLEYTTQKILHSFFKHFYAESAL